MNQFGRHLDLRDARLICIAGLSGRRYQEAAVARTYFPYFEAQTGEPLGARLAPHAPHARLEIDGGCNGLLGGGVARHDRPSARLEHFHDGGWNEPRARRKHVTVARPRLLLDVEPLGVTVSHQLDRGCYGGRAGRRMRPPQGPPKNVRNLGWGLISKDAGPPPRPALGHLRRGLLNTVRNTSVVKVWLDSIQETEHAVGDQTGTDKSAEKHGDEPRRQMTLTIPPGDDPGMVFVEKRAELCSAAGLQWPQRGSTTRQNYQSLMRITQNRRLSLSSALDPQFDKTRERERDCVAMTTMVFGTPCMIACMAVPF